MIPRKTNNYIIKIMKKIFKLLVFSFMITLYSCQEEDGDCKNPPKLSIDKLIFDNKGGSQELTVSNYSRFANIKYNDKDFDPYNESEFLKIIRNKDYTSYKHNDFTIKAYENKIIVIMNENNNESKRQLDVTIAQGNCFTRFSAEQKNN